MPQAKKKRSAEQASEPEVDQRWWVIVVPTDPERGSGRYGVWEHKPTVTIASDNETAIVKGQPLEPVLYITKSTVLTFAVGQMAHFDAAPISDAADQS